MVKRRQINGGEVGGLPGHHKPIPILEKEGGNGGKGAHQPGWTETGRQGQVEPVRV